ncbi:hypothetical protein GBA52_004501 [Prunus armeniaca]|nr:hypothetical protein GBA52_004501 [Prunus armeniaca]
MGQQPTCVRWGPAQCLPFPRWPSSPVNALAFPFCTVQERVPPVALRTPPRVRPISRVETNVVQHVSSAFAFVAADVDQPRVGPVGPASSHLSTCLVFWGGLLNSLSVHHWCC